MSDSEGYGYKKTLALLGSSGTPVTGETSAVPAPACTGFPLTTATLIAVYEVGLICGGMLVHRW
jgi:hypothetical protein